MNDAIVCSTRQQQIKQMKPKTHRQTNKSTKQSDRQTEPQLITHPK